MPKPPRLPRLEKSCPLPITHTRLHQVHEQWHRVAADYGDPDAFITSLNAALVSLRSVSFMLNKEKSQIPDFDDWYAPYTAEYQADPVMRWLKDARNFVEKEGDLELHSRARVRLLAEGQEDVPEVEFDVSPLLTQDEIALDIGPRLPERVRSHCVLAVERRWVAADQPDHELLDLLAHGYGKVAEVVAAAHAQCGVRMQTFGDEDHTRRPQRREQLGGRLSCMVAHAALRTAHVHLARNELIVTESRDREMRREDIEDFELPFPVPEEVYHHVPGESILDFAGRMEQFARAFVDEMGFHLPMVMVFENRDLAPVIINLYAADQQEQVLMIEAVVTEVERVNAEGIVFVSEIREGDDADGELLVAAVTDDGGQRVWRTPITRRGERDISLGPTTVSEGVIPDFLLPVRRAWVAMGRGPVA